VTGHGPVQKRLGFESLAGQRDAPRTECRESLRGDSLFETTVLASENRVCPVPADTRWWQKVAVRKQVVPLRPVGRPDGRLEVAGVCFPPVQFVFVGGVVHDELSRFDCFDDRLEFVRGRVKAVLEGISREPGFLNGVCARAA
jgi:hypothetical protein